MSFGEQFLRKVFRARPEAIEIYCERERSEKIAKKRKPLGANRSRGEIVGWAARSVQAYAERWNGDRKRKSNGLEENRRFSTSIPNQIHKKKRKRHILNTSSFFYLRFYQRSVGRLLERGTKAKPLGEASPAEVCAEIVGWTARGVHRYTERWNGDSK